MRKFLLFTPAILLTLQAAAQKPFKRSTIYGEILGSGVILSVNYEKQVSNKPGLGWYTGIGLGGDYPVIPAGLKYLFKQKNDKSFIEGGAGIIVAERGVWGTKYQNISDKLLLSTAFIPSIGYRHHTHYGLMWRLNYTPIFSSYRVIPIYGGISIGWRL